MNPQSRTSGSAIFTTVVILLLCAMVLLLGFQNRKLKQALASAGIDYEIEYLHEGDAVHPVKVQSMDGETSSIRFSGSSTKVLLFVFSTTCPHCVRTIPVWNTLAKYGSDVGCNAIGISVDSLRASSRYAIDQDVKFYVTSAEQPSDFRKDFKISAFPMTVLIKAGGIVEHAWVGELSNEQVSEIRSLMSANTALMN